MTILFLNPKGASFYWNFWLISFAFLAGLILSILSWFELCVEHCSANQSYHLFGFPFAIIGMAFFTTLLLFHFLSIHKALFSRLVGWMIGTAFGAEIMFIIVQKYQIGHWCPVCLSIAGSVGLAALILSIGYFKNLIFIIQHQNQGNIMLKIQKG